MTGVEVFCTPTPLWFYFESEGWMNATWVFSFSESLRFSSTPLVSLPAAVKAQRTQLGWSTHEQEWSSGQLLLWRNIQITGFLCRRSCFFFSALFSRNSQVHYLTTRQFERCLFQISAGWILYRSDRILWVPELGFVGYISVNCWDSFFTIEQFFLEPGMMVVVMVIFPGAEWLEQLFPLGSLWIFCFAGH